MPASLAFSWAGLMTYPAIKGISPSVLRPCKGFGASQFYLLAQLRVAIIAAWSPAETECSSARGGDAPGESRTTAVHRRTPRKTK